MGETELRDFNEYHEKLGDTAVYNACEKPGVPMSDLPDLDAYIEYLKATKEDFGVNVPGHSETINGGAQYRRMMFEVETFLRFSSDAAEIKTEEIMQSFGIGMNSIGWRE